MAMPPVSVWRATLAGLCGSLVGIGLARFAYTPLIPALIAAGWFTPAQAAYLGATNFLGYLAGALGARALIVRLPARAVLRGAMVVATVAFFACASPVSFPWFSVWRFLAGVSGGVLMVLAAPTIMPFVPLVRRGVALGAIFTGVGIGIAASGLLVPPLLRGGVSTVWLGLGGLSIILTAFAWTGWPPAPAAAAAAAAPRVAGGTRLWAVIVAYGLNAIGLVPHMVFLVDFVARGLHRGLDAGARWWVVFGLAALTGPTLCGAVADRIGFRAAYRLALVLQGVAVALILVSTGPTILFISVAVAGICAPGVVVLALGRVHLLLPAGSPEARAGWSYATTAWAVGQVGGAYAFSFMFSRLGDYAPLFAAGTIALIGALAVDLAFGGYAKGAAKLAAPST